MGKIYFITVFFLLLTISSSSQDNNANIWYFGMHAGLDFNSGVPSVLNDGEINTKEGCSSVCDENGSLLFYTNGSYIWNAQHEVMLNGSALMGDSSATQSSIIVPKPSYDPNNTIYYVFTVDNFQDNLVNGFRFSVVDMSLDGGSGGIISTQKNILLHDQVPEKVCAVMHANNHDVWVITHDWGSSDFLAYLLTEDSLNTTPVTTSIGGYHGGDYRNAVGYMKASVDGSKIGVAFPVATFGTNGNFEVFDFDRNSGILSNARIADNQYRPYGLEFSPDGTKLYCTSITWTSSVPSKIHQFDLDASNFEASKLNIETSYDENIMGLQLGPNGKIYVSLNYNEYLSCINDPNNIGANCNYVEQAFDLESGVCRYGMPTLFYYKGFRFFTGSEVDITICEGDSVFLEGAYQTTEGTYVDIEQTALGWDSIVNTNLMVNGTILAFDLTENAGVLHSIYGSNYQWYYNGNLILGATSQDYQTSCSGNYQVVVLNTNDCDAWSNVFFIENGTTINVFDTQTACDSFTWIDGNTYTESNNTATYTYANVVGCDSLVTLNLTINTIDVSVTQDGPILTADETGADYQWLKCPEMIDLMDASSPIYTASENGSFAVVITQQGCVDTSACFDVEDIGIIENDFGSEIIVYPNPTDGHFSVELGNVYEKITINIMDITGQLIQTKSFNYIQLINLELGNNSCVYILEIATEQKRAIVRLIMK